MFKPDHTAIAKAVRDAASVLALDSSDLLVLAETMANACEGRTSKPASFDREMFMAWATSPVLRAPADKPAPKE